MSNPVEKVDLKALLLEDFIKHNPTSTRKERVEVYSRLGAFSLEDLKLLVSQIKREPESTDDL